MFIHEIILVLKHLIMSYNLELKIF